MTEIQGASNGAGMRVGITVARFNASIGDGLLASCTGMLAKLGVRTSDVTIVSVPGALEIPLALQRMAGTGEFDALIALGAVIRGETYHFEIVSNESASGIMAVQLDMVVGDPRAARLHDRAAVDQVLHRDQHAIDEHGVVRRQQ